MLNLIYNRTTADVENKTKRGYYNAEDLNRVNTAMDYIVSEFEKLGNSVVGYVKGPVWKPSDIPNKTQMSQYLKNVQAIRSSLSVLKSTPETPESMEKLSYLKANDIEKIIFDVESIIKSASLVFIKSDAPAAFSGVGYYWPEIYYFLLDSKGVSLFDVEGVGLRAK